MRETKVPSIPAINKENTVEVLQAIKDILEVREGKRGDELDQVATLRDLVALELVDTGGSVSRTNAGGTGYLPVVPPGWGSNDYNPETDLTTPPAPTNLIARPGITDVLLFWDNATYKNHSYTEVWRSDTDVLGDAVRIGTTSGFSFSDAVKEGRTYYYWVRFVSATNVIGPYNQTSGTIAITELSPERLLTLLTGEITASQLHSDLGSRINLIDGPVGLVGSVNARIGAVQTQVNDLAGTSEYAAGTTYQVNAIVKYNGGLYRAKQTTTGNLPTNTTYWEKIGDYASIGEAVAGLATQMSDRYTKAETNSAISSATSSLVSSNALNQALGQKNRTYRQTNQPDPGSSTTGDLWFDSDDNNKAYRFNGTVWEATDDARIGSTLASLTNDYYTKTATNSAIASATSNLVSSTQLSNALGDYTNNAGLTATYYTKTQTDSAISAATANLVSSSALNNYVLSSTLSTNYYTKTQTDGAISNSSSFLVARMDTSSSKTFYQSTAPIRRGYDNNNVSLPLVTGDTWIDTANGNRQYTWNGTSWTLSADTRIQDAFNSAAAAQAAADGTIKTYFQTSPPTGLAAGDVGDLWFDTDDTNKIYRWNGSSWTAAQDTRIATAIADASSALSTAQTKITTFFQTSQPTATTVGDLWIDTDDNNKPYRWNGSSWVTIRDGNIAAVDARVTNVERAKIGYATRNSTGQVFEGDGQFTVYPVATYPDATFPEYAANRTTIIDKVGVDRWNANFPADQVTWRIGLPIATAVKQIGVSDGTGTLTIEQRFTAQKTTNDALYGQYTVKIDNNGYVTGYGLASTATNGMPSSTFSVRADKFYIANPSGPGIAPAAPFIVQTVPTTINGESVPVGVYIDTAYIRKGTITSAYIGDLAAGKITAGTISAAVTMTTPVIKSGAGAFFGSTGFFLGYDGATPKFYVGNGSNAYISWNGTTAAIAGTIVATAGSIGGNTITSDGIQSPNYIPGSTGWRIASTGAAEFRNIVARGDIQASSLQTNVAMVNTANIVDAAITTAKIADAQITNAKIVNASVDTLKIAGEAVTVPRFAEGVSTGNYITSNWTGDLLTINYDVSGLNNQSAARVMIIAVVQVYSSSFNAISLDLGIFAGSSLNTVIASTFTGDAISMTSIGSWLVGDGSYTASIRARSAFGQSKNDVSFICKLIALTAKR